MFSDSVNFLIFRYYVHFLTLLYRVLLFSIYWQNSFNIGLLVAERNHLWFDKYDESNNKLLVNNTIIVMTLQVASTLLLYSL